MLVNNAGANFARQPSEWDPAIFEDSVRINLFGAFRLAAACKSLLTRSALDGGASVVNVASMSAFFAVPVVPGYGAAKAGIVQMTKNLAAAWAADGIRVNAVAPGLIASNMTAGLRAVPAAAQPQIERTAMQPLGRTRRRRAGIPLPRQRRRALHHRPDPERRRRLLDHLTDFGTHETHDEPERLE